MSTRQFMAALLLVGTSCALAAPSGTSWPRWDEYRARFVDSTGRVIDGDGQGRTTSEGQAYAMFFALVANDRVRFAQLLDWTENNLANGNLAAQLPAWLWGKSKTGEWTVLDDNSASDADLWLAFTLTEGGRLWGEPRYRALGEVLAQQIAEREVTDLPGLGPVLMPGSRGFRPQKDLYLLNPSYLPAQLLLLLAERFPEGPWGAIASLVPQLVRLSAPKGFAMDWVAYRPGPGFLVRPFPGKPALGSYDAIRVYLWAGMLDPATPRRDELLKSLSGMTDYLRRHACPPALVSPDGQIKDANGSVGFSAAVVPFLAAVGDEPALDVQKQLLALEVDKPTALHAGYYDQSLTLISAGWSEGYFRFGPNGNLRLAWKMNSL